MSKLFLFCFAMSPLWVCVRWEQIISKRESKWITRINHQTSNIHFVFGAQINFTHNTIVIEKILFISSRLYCHKNRKKKLFFFYSKTLAACTYIDELCFRNMASEWKKNWQRNQISFNTFKTNEKNHLSEWKEFSRLYTAQWNEERSLCKLCACGPSYYQIKTVWLYA